MNESDTENVKKILRNNGDDFWRENHSDMEGGEVDNTWLFDEILEVLNKLGYDLVVVLKTKSEDECSKCNSKIVPFEHEKD